jgi:hypothetical protein
MSILLVPLANHGPELFQDRKRDKVRAERLAAGQPLEFTKSLSKEVRTKISWAMLDSVPSKFDEGGQYRARLGRGGPVSPTDLVQEVGGRTTGLTHFGGIEPRADVTGYLINDATDEHRLRRAARAPCD